MNASKVIPDHATAIEVEDIGIFNAGPVPGNLADVAGQSPVSEVMTLSEAVINLGLSERTIRRRLKAGLLQSTKDESGKLLIICQAMPGTTPDTARQVATATWQPFDTEKLWQLLSEYRQQVQDQAGKIETLRARNGYLEAQLETKIALLEDRNRVWWRRLWDWLKGS